MRTEEDIRGSMNLWNAYAEQAKRLVMTAGDADEAGQNLRKMFDCKIRAEMLAWVLQESK